MEHTVIREAGDRDAPSVGALFHQYRLFYNIDSNIDESTAFISQRIHHRDSTIFAAYDDSNVALGFVLLYPLFSEVTLKRVWLVNDLYVDEPARKRGVAQLLMRRCEQFVRENGGSELTLATAPDNSAAQALYSKLGYKRNEQFWVYNLYLQAETK